MRIRDAAGCGGKLHVVSLSLSPEALEGLSVQVVNELALLEDRAIRAEQQAAHLRSSLEEARGEIDILRQVVEEMREFGETLARACEATAEQAAENAKAAEQMLVRGLVIGAG